MVLNLSARAMCLTGSGSPVSSPRGLRLCGLHGSESGDQTYILSLYHFTNLLHKAHQLPPTFFPSFEIVPPDQPPILHFYHPSSAFCRSLEGRGLAGLSGREGIETPALDVQGCEIG